MKLSRTEAFKKDYMRLPPPAKKAAAKQITQLLIDHNHPSLRLEGIVGHRGLFSARVNRRYRMSLAFVGGDTIQLRRILDHDELYRSP